MSRLPQKVSMQTFHCMLIVTSAECRSGLCRHARLHVCTHTHTHIHTCTYTHMHAHTHKHTHKHTHTYIHMHITCMHTYKHTYTHTNTHTYTHKHQRCSLYTLPIYCHFDYSPLSPPHMLLQENLQQVPPKFHLPPSLQMALICMCTISSAT